MAIVSLFATTVADEEQKRELTTTDCCNSCHCFQNPGPEVVIGVDCWVSNNVAFAMVDTVAFDDYVAVHFLLLLFRGMVLSFVDWSIETLPLVEYRME